MKAFALIAGLIFGISWLSSCSEDSPSPSSGSPQAGALPGQASCELVQERFGPQGVVPIQVETLVSGLDVPWAIAFLPNGDALVTERPGRVRRVRSGGTLDSDPVLELTVGEQGEGGLMGIAVDPSFASNRRFFVYYTAISGGGNVNRLARYRLEDSGTSATLERILLDGIPAGTFHNGGRIHFGPDGLLYVGTGDARDPELSQDGSSFAGKLLRVSPESGETTVHVSGIRNTQGFDWWNDSTLVISDHGPSGELGMSGLDEINVASAGDNLGWPEAVGCQQKEGMIRPFLAWQTALPPGGAIVYRGGAIPQWSDSILVSSLGGQHLHRILPDGTHESYLGGDSGFGRLREVVTAPDGSVWVTTSNCDGRGSCGSQRDRILRITQGG